MGWRWSLGKRLLTSLFWGCMLGCYMGVSQYWGPPHHWTPPHHEIPNAGSDWLWSHLSNTNVKTLLYKTLTAKRCRKAEPYFGLWQGFSRGLRAGQRAKYRGGRAATAPLGDAWCGRMADKNERRKERNNPEHTGTFEDGNS